MRSWITSTPLPYFSVLRWMFNLFIILSWMSHLFFLQWIVRFKFSNITNIRKLNFEILSLLIVEIWQHRTFSKNYCNFQIAIKWDIWTSLPDSQFCATRNLFVIPNRILCFFLLQWIGRNKSSERPNFLNFIYSSCWCMTTRHVE